MVCNGMSAAFCGQEKGFSFLSPLDTDSHSLKDEVSVLAYEMLYPIAFKYVCFLGNNPKVTADESVPIHTDVCLKGEKI